jgi:DNA-binding NarL/FixJ family response regulator
VLPCAEAGAPGYRMRERSEEELVAVLEKRGSRRRALLPQIAAALIKHVGALATSGPAKREVQLTRSELEIASLVEKGLSKKAIAQRLVIGVATVKSHVHNILEKLKMTRRSDAAAWLQGHPKVRETSWWSELVHPREIDDPRIRAARRPRADHAGRRDGMGCVNSVPQV